MLWNEPKISLRLLYDDFFFLHLEVTTTGGQSWKITAVYASPNSSVRRHLWGKLDGLEVSRPWALVGDFNCVLEN